MKKNHIQEVVLFLSDFTFQDPLKVFKDLQSKHANHMPSEGDHQQHMVMDLNDVEYDAFLTNWRTLSDQEIVKVTPEKEIRLRIINGSSSTNFFIHLGQLKGEAIAVDGSDIVPLEGLKFD